MKQIIPFAHELLKQTIEPNDVVVDATLGNGHDSLFLSHLVGENGQVYAFDIQQEAIDQSTELFSENGINNVEMILEGHELAEDELTKRHVDEIGGAIFNLGYLPGSDKQVTTTSRSTIQAIDGLFSLLKKERYIIIVVYPGHEEGAKEKDDLINYLRKYPAREADVAIYQMINRSEKAPFVVALYKK